MKKFAALALLAVLVAGGIGVAKAREAHAYTCYTQCNQWTNSCTTTCF